MVHAKCRTEFYSTTDVKRFIIEDDEQVYYEIDYAKYEPVHYEAEILQTAIWADKVRDQLYVTTLRFPRILRTRGGRN